MSAWTTWNGTSEITATNGYYIAVAETEPDFSCEKVGKTKITTLPEIDIEIEENSAGGNTITVETDAPVQIEENSAGGNTVIIGE